MAEGKKGVIVYADWIEKFEELEDDEAGRLIKHFFRYVNDQNPIAPDRITKLMFVDIKNSLKRDLVKYEEKKEERSINGRIGNLKRYHKDIYDKFYSKEITLEEAEEIVQSRKTSPSDDSDSKQSPPIAKLAVTDTDTVTGTVTDSDINDIDVDLGAEKIFKIKQLSDRFTQELKDGKHDLAIEQIYMRLKIRKGSLKKVLEDFKGQLIIDQKLHKNIKELLSHFNNYCNMQEKVGKLDEYKTTKKAGAL